MKKFVKGSAACLLALCVGVLLAVVSGCDALTPGTGGTVTKPTYNVKGNLYINDGDHNTLNPNNSTTILPPPESEE